MTGFSWLSILISYNWTAIFGGQRGWMTSKKVTEIWKMLLIAPSLWNCYVTVTTKTLISQTRQNKICLSSLLNLGASFQADDVLSSVDAKSWNIWSINKKLTSNTALLLDIVMLYVCMLHSHKIGRWLLFCRLLWVFFLC